MLDINSKAASAQRKGTSFAWKVLVYIALLAFVLGVGVRFVQDGPDANTGNRPGNPTEVVEEESADPNDPWADH